MKTTHSRSKVSQEAVARASDWFVEFRVGDADEAAREEFTEWLRLSPENVQAYLEIARTYAELPAISPEGKVDVDALTAYAHSEGNVIPLAPRVAMEARPPATSRSSIRTRRVLVTLAASILVAVAGAGAWFQLLRDTYSTDIGEQRSITLGDGSTVDLNAHTRIRVRMTEHERRIELLEGQALFQVAKDSRRPFIVRSNGTQIRAVGTRFDVYQRTSGTTVTVLEGRVKVDAAAMSADLSIAMAEPVFLVAGEQVTVTRERIVAPMRTDVAAATAWTQRRLVFDGSPLPQVAEEFNRYSKRPLVIANGQLTDFRISGVYSSIDPASLVLFLRAQPGIDVTETDTEIRVSSK